MSIPDATSNLPQVALVTGGGRGLGRAFAGALAETGAAVAVVARSAEQLQETVDAIRQKGGRAFAFPADVTDEEAVRGSFAAVVRQLGPITLLVNNAGIGGPIGATWEIGAAEWWRCFEVNLKSAFLCAKAALPGMIASGRGRIINVSSAAGNEAIPGFSSYVTSKAALTRFTEVLAGEAQAHGISVFAMEPGTVRTAMTEELMTSKGGKQWIPWVKDVFQHGRDTPPEHVAELVVWLASGEADSLSGRFISRSDNRKTLVKNAKAIRESTLYTLRVSTFSRSFQVLRQTRRLVRFLRGSQPQSQ
jgi:NAD(P)-dependent dehydrogenase (short-subunit alcohol dehydrogenase family)